MSDSSSPSDTSTAATPSHSLIPVRSNKARNRRRAMTIVAILVVVALGLGAAYYFLFAAGNVSTDDAYVQDDVVEISAEVAGTATMVYVQSTQSVKKGQLLASLDPADAKVDLATAEANLASAVRGVRARFASAEQFRAQLEERQTTLQRAQDDLGRRSALLADGAVSGEELAHARDAVASARASLDATRENLNALIAEVQGTTVENHPDVLRAAAAVRSASLALRRTQLYAPVDGVIANRTLQVGHRVAAGQPLMAIIPLDYAWVDANFKEPQLRHMRLGQPATLRADLYGSDVTYHGHVVGVAAGTGSAFALLPAQNATGNWIKIVQRLPVRILLDPRELHDHPLRVGLSMNVMVDVSNESGPGLGQVSLPQPLPANASEGGDPAVEQSIQKIIRQNAGRA